MEGDVDPVGEGKVRTPLKKTKNRKSVEPDQIPAVVWKSLGEEGKEYPERIEIQYNGTDIRRKWKHPCLNSG